VGAGVALLASLLVVFGVREAVTVAEAVTVTVGTRSPYRELANNLKQVFAGEKSLLYLLLANLFWSMGFCAIFTFVTSYVKFELGLSESTGALILGVFAASFMLAAIGAGYAGSILGRKKSILSGLAAITLVLLTIGQLTTLVPMTILFGVGGLVWSLVIVNALPMVVDMADDGNEGGYTGLYYFASQLGAILAPVSAGALIDRLGYGWLWIFCAFTFGVATLLMIRVQRGEIKRRV
jgi:MFS family permease